MSQHRLVDYEPQTADFIGPAAVAAGRHRVAPAEELNQAAELLEQLDSNQAESFLTTLVEGWRHGASDGQSPALARLLAPLARRLVPCAGVAPSTASAGRLLGLELEGLSAEDQAFELARHFVQFARTAARQLTPMADAGSPALAARRAAIGGARRVAPGLLPALGAAPPPMPPRRAQVAGVFDFKPRRDGEPGSFHPTKEPVMHDIDRTQMEFGSELPGFEAEQYEYGEGEWGQESGYELNEADEFELASELLGVASEDELDQFLGSLIKKVARGAGKLIRSPIGQAIGGVLKGVAKKALPLAGGALGGMVGGPLGAKIGSGLASAAGGALGLEAEAMSQEDQEFEGAKQFVKLAADTVAKAASASPSSDPRAVAQAAAISAAKQHAPGLLKAAGALSGQGAASGRGQGGRWARRGNTIVLYGA